MAMKITDNKFYMVKLPDHRSLHGDEDEAIQYLKDNAKGLDSENADVNVVKISIDDDDWTIAEMSWQSIALQMMGD